MDRNFLVLSCVILFAIFTARANADEIHVSAATSLMNAMKDIAVAYKRDGGEADLLLNFASSGALARQISVGAPVDLYISANPKWMVYVQKYGIVPPSSEVTLVSNRLVFVGREGGARTMEGLTKLQRIALGSPKSTPVGRYTEQALTRAGVFTALQRKQKLILAKDVRQALLYADRGETDGAFVYRTDALLAEQATILFEVPQGFYPQVVYPAALTRSGLEKGQACRFFDFLFQKTAQNIFKKYGFILPGEGS